MSRLITARGFRPSRRRPRLELLEDRIAPAMIVWGNSSGGDWDTAANWQGGVKPGPADDAVINIAVTNPITHSQNIADVINSLSVTAKAPVNLGNGTLQIAGTLASNGSFTIAGGTLRNATVPAGTTITAVNSSNTLSGVTLDGTLDMGSVFAPKMTVTSGLTLNGTILLGGANGSDVGTLTAQGTQAWSGTGSILFGGSDTTDLDISSGATLTLGAGLTLHGQSGEITGTFINQGTINADLAGRTAGSTADEDLTLIGTGWINQGTLQVDNGATLNTAGTWSNTGKMNVQAGATLNLGGSFTTAGLGIFAPAPAGSFSRTGGTVNVTGTLDNTGSTLALDSRTGGWNVFGGTIIGGTITTSGGNVLTAVNSSNTLSGVTLDGTLDMGSVFAPKMNVTSGLTLNGTILLGGANGSDVGALTAEGTQAWSGTGSILFGGSDTTDLDISSGTLTLGAGLTLHGQSGEITGTFINQGTINADLAGRPAGSTADEDWTLIGTGWINQGTLQVDNGATLNTAGTWSNTGKINVQAGATLNLGGSFTTAGLGIFAPAPAGSFSRTGGTVNVTGTLDNTGSTLALDSRTGGWNVFGGTIIGGTITTSGGNVLTAVNSSNTLSGVTLDGTLDMGSVFAPKMNVTSGLTLNGTILLGGANGSDSATLTAQGTQAWSGTGSILFGGSDTTDLDISSGTLTLGAGLTLHGQSGEITGTFINQGTINADLAGRTAGSTADEDLTLIGTGWINQGTLQVDNGATLNTAGTWSNTGTMNEQLGGTLNLGGSFKSSTLGTINGAPGTVNITGTLTNDATLALTDKTGSWVLAPYGTINGGTITTSGNAELIGQSSVSVLNGVTLAGTLELMTAGVVQRPHRHRRIDPPAGPHQDPRRRADLRGHADPGRHRRGGFHHARCLQCALRQPWQHADDRRGHYRAWRHRLSRR